MRNLRIHTRIARYLARYQFAPRDYQILRVSDHSLAQLFRSELIYC